MQEEIIYDDLQPSEVAGDVTVEEVVQVIEVTDVEAFEVEMDEAFPALGEIDALNHALLNNRELHDAHPITAITGLREELDSIEALQTIYSDKKGNADYYEWADGNYGTENRIGLFVSLDRDVRKISICTGDDIFGVVVDNAAFVGGQDNVARDVYYGLVATTGVAHVRCELNVEVGDYIVSNSYGVATKAGSNCGYKVVAIHDIDGAPHATIKLNISADQIDSMGADLQDLGSRMDAAETNIVSAVNVANAAYNKANEAIVSNQIMSDRVNGALGTVDKVVTDVENLGEQVSNSALVSAQAKAIAESAATSAESMRNEAVAKANEALADTSELRKEFETKATEIDAELDNTTLELQTTKEELNAAINDLKLDTEGQIADFQKEVSENYATTAQLAAVKTETSDAIAVVKQEVSDTYATIESVAALRTETSEAMAGFKQEVADNYATQEMLTQYKNDTSEALSSYKAEVAENYATQEMVSTLETNTTKALSDYKQEVTDTYATQEMVTKLETDTGKALSDYKQEVGETYATQESVTTLRTDTTKAIAASEEKATNTYASKGDLTSFESKTNIAMARIEQKADANGAYIQSTVSNMDKYAVGPYSQAYGFTLEQATSVLEEGMMYVPTETKTGEKAETYNYTDTDGSTKTYTREFVKHYLYKWGKIGDRYGWITVDKNYNETTETNTSGQAVYFTTTVPAVSGNFGYWYTDGDTVTEGYEPYTLYKWESYVDEGNTTQYHWVAVATLAGNSQSRAVSQIRQDANSIELRVTNVEGSAAVSKQWIDDNSANIQDVVTWKGENADTIATFMATAEDNFASTSQVAQIVDKDGNINAASIVTAVNEAGSSVVINADHIKFDGFVSFANKSDVDEVKNNATYDTKVEYALSSSVTEFVKVTEWSTVAPTWQLGAYMWQRITITKGDGTEIPGEPTCIQGATGERGTDGDGVTYKYCLINSDTKPIYPTPSDETYVWTPNPTGVSEDNQYEYVVSIVVSAIESTAKKINTAHRSFTQADWEKYGVEGHEENWTIRGDGSLDNSHIYLGDYAYVEGTVSDTNPTQPAKIYGKVISLSNSSTQGGNIRMRSSLLVIGDHEVPTSNVALWAKWGEKGKDGNTPTIEINDDGYWVINGTTTSTKAEGADGSTPTVEINADGYWVINGTVTDIKARGEDGQTGTSVTKVVTQYYISTGNTADDKPGNTASDDNGWFEDFDTMLTRYWALKDANPETTYYIWSQERVDYSNIPSTYSEPTVNGASSVIALYCKDNGVTKIDGANIATGSITADQIDTSTLIVGENIQMGENAVISWEKVENKPDVATKSDVSTATADAVEEVKALGYQTSAEVTTTATNITKTTIETVELTAQKLKVNAANILGELTAEQIAANTLKSTNYDSGVEDSLIPNVVSKINPSRYSKVGTYFDFKNGGIYTPNFCVTTDGRIGAIAGTIGPWDITSEKLSTGQVGLVGNYQTYYYDSLISGQSAIRIYAGSSTAANAPFKVLNDGSVYASAVKLGSGNVGSSTSMLLNTTNMKGTGGFFEGESTVAEDGTVTRAGDAIDDWRMTVGSGFGVTSNGVVYAKGATIEGSLFSTGGNFTGTVNASKNSTFGKFRLGNEGNSLYNGDEGGSLGAEKLLVNKILDSWGRGGTIYFGAAESTGSTNINFTANTTFPNSSSVALTITPSIAPTKSFTFKVIALYQMSGLGSYAETEDVSLEFSSSATSAQTVTYSKIKNNSNGASTQLLTLNSITVTYQNGSTLETKLFNSMNTSATQIFNLTQPTGQVKPTVYCGGHFNPGGYGYYDLGSKAWPWQTLYCTSNVNNVSDQRTKNSIENLPVQYENFFDNWNPVRYKYNDGTSDRYHTGFIAQEVVSALTDAGLTTQDFAGVMLLDPGTEKECWHLRRDEFVALNTWQIQKLKARTAELEAKVAELEARLTTD